MTLRKYEYSSTQKSKVIPAEMKGSTFGKCDENMCPWAQQTELRDTL